MVLRTPYLQRLVSLRELGDRHWWLIDSKKRLARPIFPIALKTIHLKVIEPRPAFGATGPSMRAVKVFVPLSGISLEVDIETGAKKERMVFREDSCSRIVGFSVLGSATSSYWQAIRVNLYREP